jgi:CheY-like chemotaxis protein
MAWPIAGDRSTRESSILVVDDNADAADMVALLLQSVGYRVAIAHEGRTAVELAKALRPDVVVLDIGMPGIDGFETARRLRRTTADSKLIAVTAYGGDDHRRRGADAGFDFYLVKPVSFDALARAIESCAAR